MRSFVFFLLLVLTCFSPVYAEQVKVGYFESPPFVYSTSSGLKGINVVLWEKIAQEEKLSFTYLKFNDYQSLVLALQRDSIQIGINNFRITPNLVKNHEVSVPTFIGTTGVLTKYDFKHRSWYKAMFEIISFDFIKVSVLVGGIIFLFGFLMWLVEKKNNSEHFDNSRKGLVDSFWWSAVTMTTVGYGDKYPVTFSGKLIALIWMFTAMIIIASLTAGITMILTVSNLSSGITATDDLDRLHVGTIKSSSSDEFLTTHVVPVRFNQLEEAMVQLKEDELDVIVYDKAQLIHYIGMNQLQKEMEILPIEWNKQMMGFVYSKTFADKKKIDVQITKLTQLPFFTNVLAREGLVK